MVDKLAEIPDSELRERVLELHAWAASRIEHCRALENKFLGRPASSYRHVMPQTAIEAWTERRALEAVLRIVIEGPR